jgi:hypothetical protein
VWAYELLPDELSQVVMHKQHSFKFVDEGLNREFVGSLERAGIDHIVGEGGVVYYSEADQEIVENDLICSIRDMVFPSWQILTFPDGWAENYRDYMSRHDVPLKEEISDGELGFLIPRKYRPHSWKLVGPVEKERPARNKVG